MGKYRLPGTTMHQKDKCHRASYANLTPEFHPVWTSCAGRTHRTGQPSQEQHAPTRDLAKTGFSGSGSYGWCWSTGLDSHQVIQPPGPSRDSSRSYFWPKTGKFFTYLTLNLYWFVRKDANMTLSGQLTKTGAILYLWAICPHTRNARSVTISLFSVSSGQLMKSGRILYLWAI